MYTQSVRDTDWVPAHDDIYSLITIILRPIRVRVKFKLTKKLSLFETKCIKARIRKQFTKGVFIHC